MLKNKTRENPSPLHTTLPTHHSHLSKSLAIPYDNITMITFSLSWPSPLPKPITRPLRPKVRQTYPPHPVQYSSKNYGRGILPGYDITVELSQSRISLLICGPIFHNPAILSPPTAARDAWNDLKIWYFLKERGVRSKLKGQWREPFRFGISWMAWDYWAPLEFQSRLTFGPCAISPFYRG